MYATSLEKKRASEYSMTPCHEATGKENREKFVHQYVQVQYMFVCESGVCMLNHTCVLACTYVCMYIHRQEMLGDSVRTAGHTEVFLHMHKVLSLTGIRRALKKPMACSFSSTMVCPC